MKLTTALIIAFPLALIVWYCARHIGYSVDYWTVLVALVVAKLIALFLSNEPNEITIGLAYEKSEK